MTPELARWTADQLGALGYRTDFRPTPLLVEASHRLFYRVQVRSAETPRTTFVVMSSPPDKELNDQFVALAAVFANHGVGVPEVLAQASDAGYFLLSDLGARHFADVYGSHEQDAALAAGINTLIHIQAVVDPQIPPYEAQRFRDELHIFREWFVEGWLAADFPSGDLDGVFEALVANTQDQQQCCVHRDFHCRNLLFAEHQAVGVVDFQDALMGPASYDLASLLRDCYHRFPEPEIARWRDHYLQRTPFQLDPEAFAMQLDLTAVQRQLKAVGIFARLQLRDGKSSHLQHIPPVLAQLQDLAEHYPTLAPLRPHLTRWRGAVADRLGNPQS
ncbi:MAG: phosphotransferase [Gammaproteobacteria bacterium]|nr:phosphotransferase [Gammaproteobacteria bacterium]